MTTVFFTSLHCRHPELACWFILEEAGAIHASFLPAEHRRGLAILQRQALAPPGGGGPYRLVGAAGTGGFSGGGTKIKEKLLARERRFAAAYHKGGTW